MKKCIKCNSKPKHSTLSLCRDCRIEYNNENKEIIKNYNKTRYENNKEVILSKIKKYSLEHKDTIKEWTKNWFQENKDHINKYCRDKYKNDPKYRLKITFYNTINKNIKDLKSKKTLKYLGCTLEEYRLHLEQHFKPEMTWENHGTIWEIDHIKPINSFNFEDLKEQEACFHFTNTKPLFKTTEIARSLGYMNEIGNRNKGDNYER